MRTGNVSHRHHSGTEPHTYIFAKPVPHEHNNESGTHTPPPRAHITAIMPLLADGTQSQMHATVDPVEQETKPRGR